MRFVKTGPIFALPIYEIKIIKVVPFLGKNFTLFHSQCSGGKGTSLCLKPQQYQSCPKPIDHETLYHDSARIVIMAIIQAVRQNTRLPRSGKIPADDLATTTSFKTFITCRFSGIHWISASTGTDHLSGRNPG